jgi:hypothetical protein
MAPTDAAVLHVDHVRRGGVVADEADAPAERGVRRAAEAVLEINRQAVLDAVHREVGRDDVGAPLALLPVDAVHRGADGEMPRHPLGGQLLAAPVPAGRFRPRLGERGDGSVGRGSDTCGVVGRGMRHGGRGIAGEDLLGPVPEEVAQVTEQLAGRPLGASGHALFEVGTA